MNKETTSANVTDGAGLYDTGAIVEDHYLLTFTKQGFETFVRGPINLGLEKGAVLFDGCLPPRSADGVCSRCRKRARSLRPEGIWPTFSEQFRDLNRPLRRA